MMQRSVDVGTVIQNAVFFNPKQPIRGGDMAELSLLQAVDRLFGLLEQRRIAYVLVGGIALLQYVDGRNTEDIDLIVAVSALERLPEVQIHHQDEFFAQGTLGELRIDCLLTRNRLFQRVQRDYAAPRPFAARTVPCATVEGLLLLKLYALPSLYRQGDFQRVALYEGDIAMLLEHYAPDTAALFKELSRYLSDPDLAAVEEIVAEIATRIERFRRRAGSGG
jgi:hypothetical protein